MRLPKDRKSDAGRSGMLVVVWWLNAQNWPSSSWSSGWWKLSSVESEYHESETEIWAATQTCVGKCAKLLLHSRTVGASPKGTVSFSTQLKTTFSGAFRPYKGAAIVKVQFQQRKQVLRGGKQIAQSIATDRAQPRTALNKEALGQRQMEVA
ncbi:hypothetical protein ACJ73_05340 [Blastomyces percursus]|uniref:Uncharacterized protein n=1 Tax=Blastomyces percursus TaxID=1658174 RepID=A0A1J9Q464_9EURO|nr:hypothetical protein ACJ73_05340 [Blastomyces percursus]